ncbi:Zn-ribbon domain-containing OB-fold protein [Cupriavidus metallidurans]|uniref:Zn-ribbon domain-containing OB-fold protein n=1 Tax=Cupriavidus metallidurans TaxID=119219 RepID=UPI00055A955D|nr:OB-fold domain-containing protein [Cupriavidus metallidurans]
MQTAESRSPETQAAPSLAVLRCGACGKPTYPASAYGCQYCGAEPERGTVEQMPARGTLRNYVTVHAPLVRDMPPPFVVGEVDFAEGIREEVLLDVASETELAPGMTVQGVIRADAPCGDRYPLHFVPASKEVQR